MLRGGSWNNNQNNVRDAYRNRNNPDNFNNNVGFRVVFSHNSSCRPALRVVRRTLLSQMTAEDLNNWSSLFPADWFPGLPNIPTVPSQAVDAQGHRH